MAADRVSPSALGGAILAGGASRRMGQDKALIEVGGEALIMRAATALRDAGADPLVVVGGDRAALEDLGFDYRVDQFPGEGPLGGVITALEQVERDVVAVLSCDLTDASAVAVRSVHGALGVADVAVPVVHGQAQWLHAVWRRSTLPILKDAFDQGIRAPRDAVASLRVAQLLDGDPCWYADADRPEDLPNSPPVSHVASRPGYHRPMDIPEIDVDELERQQAGGAPVFDVREPDEWDEAHIHGASLVPLGEIPESVAEFPKDRSVYIICARGGRSARAVEFLRAEGVDAINVAGGMTAWLEAGKPSLTGNGS